MRQTLFLVVLGTITISAQQNTSSSAKQTKLLTEINQKLESQQLTIKQQTAQLIRISEKTKTQDSKIDSLQSLVTEHTKNIQTIADDLGSRIQRTEISAKNSISKLDRDVNKNRLYWIIATLATLLLGGLLYWLLGRRIATSKTDVETQIKNTKKTIEEESINLDSKLIEVLESQLKIKNEEKPTSVTTSSMEVDHSLALKVADEIVRIQKNLQQMEPTTKGLKQLSASVKRIQDNFASNGYEVVEMLGKEYNEGMKVIANFIPSDNIETGKQIITRIIKPQVNFKNEMIQSSQIEVSVGE
ncbi:MAG: hypothetical protein L6264_06800 [Weeksellaceae bacterium]|nr:hypothetical protein [Bacteroidota bacterium]MCG2780639.1 hypothetical protein [Weeksellaceae bacterium]